MQQDKQAFIERCLTNPDVLDLAISGGIGLRALLEFICYVSRRLAEPHSHLRFPPVDMHVTSTLPLLSWIHELHVECENHLAHHQRRFHQSKAGTVQLAKRLAWAAK